MDSHSSSPNRLPLCVDLDGTLVRTDLLVESLLLLLKLNPLYLLLVPIWIYNGKANFKHQVARRVELDPAALPYNRNLLAYLQDEASNGRFLVLATAASSKYADQIADHLKIFGQVVATSSTNNLAGERKALKLLELFGERGFDYAADSSVDLAIWRHADTAIVVEASKDVFRNATSVARTAWEFPRQSSVLRDFLRALRIHQWLKNLLLFLPLLAAQQYDDVGAVLDCFVAFFAFGLAASSVYLLNDLLDLPNDRQHPTKCQRPLASGEIPLIGAVAAIPLLLMISATLCLLLPLGFSAILTLYLLLTLAYSLRLKQLVLIDVLVLACLYTLRVIAGGAALQISISFWLLALSLFLFFSLALLKRYSELHAVQERKLTAAAGRGYSTRDLESLSLFGIASGYAAVLVFALYINSAEVLEVYSQVEILWLICPIFLLWVSRIWLLGRRGLVDEDPIVFAMRDRSSHGMALIVLTIFFLASGKITST